MPVPSSLNDLSTTPALNSPAGSESPALVDDYLRTHAAFIKQVSDESVKLTGNQTIAGTKTFSSAPVVPGLNGGQLAGMRNKIINGNFQVNQRAYVSGTNVGAANTYTLDRWRVVASGQNITFTASGNGNLVTAPAGGLEQVVEGVNIEGGTYVLNWTGTATATVNGTARAKGESFTLTANINATVRFSSGTVGLVQLEPGTVATPFEHRPYGIELGLCRRYGRPMPNLILGQAFSASSSGHTVSLGYPMRGAPVLSTTAGYTVTTAGGGSVAATPAISSLNGDILYVTTSGASSLTAGDATLLQAPTAFLSSEL